MFIGGLVNIAVCCGAVEDPAKDVSELQAARILEGRLFVQPQRLVMQFELRDTPTRG
jgi:hypothetical protein